MIVTIDGLSGQGKSTIGKMLADKSGFEFFSTGLLVRLVAKKLMENPSLEVNDVVWSLPIQEAVLIDPALLRTPDIVPYMKRVIETEGAIVELYHLLNVYYGERNVIFDGRDTFKYFKEAALKYYFVCSLEERVAIRMNKKHWSKEECYAYFQQRDAVEREVDYSDADLILVRPLEYPSMDDLVNKMYEDIQRLM